MSKHVRMRDSTDSTSSEQINISSPTRGYDSVTRPVGEPASTQLPLSSSPARGVPPDLDSNADTAGQEEEVEEEEEEENLSTDEILKFGSKQIISLFIPVSMCMLFTVCGAKLISYYGSTDVYLPYTPFHSDNASAGVTVLETLGNTAIFIGIVVVMTFLLVLLFKFECYRIIHGWLIFTTAMILFFISFIFFLQVIQTMQVFADAITLSVIMWNFGILGMMVIHWSGPLFLQQCYLVFISAQIALLFVKFLPPWTCWVILGALAVWDLIAVLCPHGPLRMLVEMAQKREQPLFPALIYSTTTNIVLMVTGEEGSSNAATASMPPPTGTSEADISGSQRARLANRALGQGRSEGNHNPSNEETPALVVAASGSTRTPLVPATAADEDHHDDQQSAPTRTIEEIRKDIMAREDRGVKLGLGDFVFYSLLMGRASLSGDINTVAACYVAILIGMCLTILLLAIAGRALPALPISIFFGILFFFVTDNVISPFMDVVNSHQVFI